MRTNGMAAGVMALLVQVLGCSKAKAPRPLGAPVISSAARGPAAPAAEAQASGGDDAFGGLSLGLPEAAVVKLLGAPAARSEIVEEGASGLFVSTWTWPKRGVSLVMEASTRGQPTVIDAIRLAAPCSLKDAKGIGIGSTRAQVTAAFGPHISTETPRPDTITVGSIYGGIYFTMKEGTVAEVFVGAGAE